MHSNIKTNIYIGTWKIKNIIYIGTWGIIPMVWK